MSSKESLYLFHIILEAKVRALVVMMKKYHPEWDKAMVKEVLTKLVDTAYANEPTLEGAT